MNEKWTVAQRMVDEGSSNADIQDEMQARYGSGISTSKLADWRSTSESRVLKRRQAERRDLLGQKKALIREYLLAGESGYAAQQECKRRFGGGVGYERIKQIRAELEREEQAAPATAAPEPQAIVPVELPPEVMETVEDDPPDPTDLVIQAHPRPNGTADNFKAIQRWMAKHKAESVTFTAEGKLSVLSRHEFDLGGIS